MHAVEYASGGMPHVLSEASATYWDDSDDLRNAAGHDIGGLFDHRWGGGMNRSEYASAAHFLAYLVDTYGLERHLELARRTRNEDSRSRFEDAFSGAYGVSLSAAIDGYELDWPGCRRRSVGQPITSCFGDAEHLVGRELPELILEFDLSCSNPDVVGYEGEGETPRMWVETSVEFLDPGPEFPNSATIFLNESVPSGSTEVELRLCSSHCGETERYTFTLTRPDPDTPPWFTFDYMPGIYRMRVSRAIDDPGPVTLEWL